MKRYWLIIIGVILVAVILIDGFFVWRYYTNRKTAQQKALEIQSNPILPDAPAPSSLK